MTGLTLLLSGPVPVFFRTAGALWVASGVGLEFPGRPDPAGDAGSAGAAVAFSVSLTVLLAVFSLMSRGVLWLVIIPAGVGASALVMRPVAANWFHPDEPADPDA